MKYLNLHIARITRAIEERMSDCGKQLPDYGDDSRKALVMTVTKYLSDEEFLREEVEHQYNEVTRKFGCPHSPEEVLLLPTYGFNPHPIREYIDGNVSLERAVEICFEQTFFDAFADEYGRPTDMAGRIIRTVELPVDGQVFKAFAKDHVLNRFHTAGKQTPSAQKD